MKVQVFDEPNLLFAHQQQLQDPHDGLSFFGPVGAAEVTHPHAITWSVVGPQRTIDLFLKFVKVLEMPVLPPEGQNSMIWPAYPGFEAAFHSKLANSPLHAYTVDDADLLQASRHNDPNVRVGSVVDLYLSQIQRIDKQDERPSVLICLAPDFIDDNCRPMSRVKDGHGERISRSEKQLRQSGQGDFFSEYEPDHYDYCPDYRRQLKARAMTHGLPIQILLESTVSAFTPEEAKLLGKTPLSDRAWNIATAFYYKAGGKPWQLSSIRDGVCYVGLTFKRTSDNESSRSACCAAQMFLKDGDGIVFKGEEGRWYSPEDKQFHLSADAARSLLKGVLGSYNDQFGKPLTEIFLHCHSEIGEEELKGFSEACPPGARLVIIRVRQERYDFRLFREGTRPVLRGTFAKMDERTAYLWASGFKPRLAVYDGWETPAPLKISILHGEADIEQVAKDIYGLTKLNYNACRLGEANPVTIGFAGAIGDILVANPKAVARPQIKFYI